MGYIYKITNLINNECYIGQTVQNIEERFKEHKRNRKYPYFQHLKLYKAFNIYGLDNFIIQSLEEVDDLDLNKAEQKWISYYDSFKHGYNMTLGGTSRKQLNLCEEDIINDYIKLKSARKVAIKYNVDHNTIDKILHKNNITRFSLGSQRSMRVVVEKEGKINFDCIKYTAEWFVNNKLCRAATVETARKGITAAIKNNNLYYGYKIYYEQ